MSPSTRNKLLVVAAGAVGLIVVALLVAPLFIDLDRFKPIIVSEAKKATGRDLVIDGKVSGSLLPWPSASVSGVKFFNAPGSKNPNMVEVKSITVRPSLLPLLMGSLELSEVILVEPKIVLEINAEGKPNWEFAPSVAEAQPAAAKPSSPKPLSLGALTMENGTLIFSDSKGGLTMTAEKANLTAAVGSLDGPYSLAGSATLNGSPLKIDASVGAKASNGYATSASLAAGGGKLDVKGTLSELGPNARWVGTVKVSADSATHFVATLAGLAGQPAPVLPPLLAGKFAFDGGIDASQAALAAKDFKVTLGSDGGSGSLAMTLKPALSVDAKLSFAKLDLDAWLAALPPAAPAATPPPAVPASPAAPSPSAPQASKESLLAGLNAKIAIDIGEIDYHKQAVKSVAIELEARNGAVAVLRLNASLPGDMVVQAKSTFSGDPARPTAAGDFNLDAPKLRDTLKWLAIDVSSLPPDKLTRFSLKGHLTSSNGEVEVPDGTIEFDNTKASGGLVVNFGVPLSVTVLLGLDTFDLDAFLANPTAGQKPATPASSTPSASSSAAAPAGPILGLKAKVAKLVYNKQTISGIDADIGVQGGLLRLNDVKVGNFASARFAVRGAVGDYLSSLPKPDIAFNFEATDMTQFLKAAGGTAPDGLGTVTASGGITGNIEALQLKELTVSAVGETLKASGLLTMPGAAKGTPSAVGYKGSVTANGQTIDGSVDAKLTGRPNVTIDLKTTMLDLAKLSAGKPATTPARGQPAAKGAGSGAGGEPPIDTSALRAVDGSLKLAAATLVSGPLRVNNADIAATLKDGVLTLSHFKGGLYGGTLDLSGVVNANQAAVAFDIKGDANNIFLGEMLRSTSGTNTFGSAVKVTIDGKLNATSIALKGSGATATELKSSMAGGAQLGGHIFVGADKALTAIAGAASGVVSGVIDNTLGTALGVVGQKGGVGVSNMLNAASLVLNRFVNRDNPISGRIDIAGGMLTDKSLTVSGNKATANVVTRSDLGKATTDTTVNFILSEDASAPYLITTARGPLSSPSLNVARGTAKDPPGFVNTLEQGASTVTNPIKSLVPNLPSIPNIFGR